MGARVGCKTLGRLPRQLLTRPEGSLAFPTSAGGSTSEQNHGRLTQKKLTESLLNASKAFEAAFQGYQVAEAERLRQDAAAAAAAEAATAGGNERGPSPSVELSALEEGEGPHLAQQQQLDVSHAEVDFNSAIVDEFTNEITTVANDISALNRALADIHEHAQAQGVTLDSIEANIATTAHITDGATDQLTQASRHHRTGTKMFLWLLLLAAVIAGVLIIIVVRRHS